MRTLIGLMVGLLPVAAQVADYGRTAQPGAAYDFRAASKTAPARSAAGSPSGACAAGEVYFQTDAAAGRNLWLCTAADTWTQIEGGSSGGGSVNPVMEVRVVDEFISGWTSIYGDLGWTVNGGSVAATAAEPGRPGLLLRSTSGTAGTVATLSVGTSRGTFHASDGWDWTWIIRVNQLNASQTVRVGATCHASITNVIQPSDGVYLECETGECNGGNWRGVVRQGGAQTRADSGVATSTGWLKVKAQKTNTNQVTFTVNDGTPFAVTNTMPGVGCNPWLMITNGTAASSYSVTADFFQLSQTVAR